MILGIDPGLENTGWAVLNSSTSSEQGYNLVDCGVIVTKPKDISAKRLEEIFKGVEKLIKKFKIDEMAIETLFFAKNAKSAIKVSEAIGVLKLCGRKNKIEVAEYTPLQVKLALVGYGRAEKEQVESMVRSCLGLNKPITPGHASDAVAVALTHGFTMKM